MDGTQLPETRSTCPYCGVGCGVLLRPDRAGGLAVRGDPEHPANKGRLCSKGSALGETVGLSQRLLSPRVEGQDVDWSDALQTVADRFSDAIQTYGPDSVAFYVSGQLLTEDYYVANKLMKGFMGSANIDTNSRLCMASTVAGHKRAFGTDTVPGTYEDLDETDLIVLVGSNLAWCHPVLYQRVMDARASRGTKIIVVDPRRTASCDAADMHLALDPGSDVALFNALLVHLHENGHVDQAYLDHTNGFEAALEAARQDDVSVTGLATDQIAEFCALWANTDRVVTVFSQGVNQSTSGSDKVNAILNCHLATGRIGKVGMGPFSVTGQPNAMGGREVGGLANMLANHLDIENPDHRAAVQEFWQSPTLPEKPGLKAVDLFRSVANGEITALWVIHTNPAVTMPDADAVRDAIAACPFTVVSDITDKTDTARLADVLLPAAGWAEKSGTVTNSDRTISRQRPVLEAPGQARADWDILAEVGRRMGWQDAFDYDTPAQIFSEYASLSLHLSRFKRDFDISGLADLDTDAYDRLEPTRWPVRAEAAERFFADGRFFHADEKAKLLPVQYRPPAAKTEPRFPYRLNTGRVRDQWHTMTRSGLSARLSSHLAEPYLDIHPGDAKRNAIQPADLVEVTSPTGRAVLRARISDSVTPGQVFAPIHWTGETAPTGRIDAVVAGATDPVSGQPESKAAVVRVDRFNAVWYGFAISRTPIAATSDYWALARTAGGYRAELAGLSDVADWEQLARAWFGLPDTTATVVEDKATGLFRAAFSIDNRLQAALFISPQPVAVARDYLGTALNGDPRLAVMGRAPADVPDPGATVCSCFGVGINTIRDAIRSDRLTTVEDIGTALQAGTNCGSCKPELAELLTAELAGV